MRIGLVCPYSFDVPGGVQNHVLGLARWLQDRGHEVMIAAPGNDINLISNGASLGPGTPLPFNGSIARVGLHPATGRRLRAALADVDLVHVHEPLVPLVGLAAMRLGVPTVATFHAATGERLHRWLRPIAKRLAPHASIAVSTVAAAAPRAFGLDPVLIGNGIDASAFARHRRPARPTVVFLGRLDEPRKGFSVLARALPTVLRDVPDARVLAIGEGRSRPDGVTCLGRLPNDERNRILANADVLVAPHTHGESFGMVLIEAMASGAQVVGSDLPAFREVTAGVADATRLVTPNDPQALASALVAALIGRDRLDRDALVRHAHTWDWARLGPRIESVYDDAVAIA